MTQPNQAENSRVSENGIISTRTLTWLDMAKHHHASIARFRTMRDKRLAEELMYLSMIYYYFTL